MGTKETRPVNLNKVFGKLGYRSPEDIYEAGAESMRKRCAAEVRALADAFHRGDLSYKTVAESLEAIPLRDEEESVETRKERAELLLGIDKTVVVKRTEQLITTQHVVEGSALNVVEDFRAKMAGHYLPPTSNDYVLASQVRDAGEALIRELERVRNELADLRYKIAEL